MYRKRTDLALETREMQGMAGANDGILVTERREAGILITAMEITEKGASLCGKEAGHYITVDVGTAWREDPRAFEATATVISKELAKMLPAGKGCVLAAGLGNEGITPDAVGPLAVKELLVTRHIRQADEGLFQAAGFGELSALSPGVLGQTGIESAEILSAVVKRIRPRCVIAVDALAARRVARLASTVQLSDTGIRPGSGVSNHRAALTQETLGIPVIAMGIPTVVDGGTLARDLLEEVAPQDPRIEEILKDFPVGKGNDLFVSPKDMDALASAAAKLLGTAVNLAIHPDLTIEELLAFPRGF
jgi:spore protease